MKKKFMNFATKYEEIISYVLVGLVTTAFAWSAQFLWNFLAYNNPSHPTSSQNFVLSIVNWTSVVVFGFFVNRKYVFKSENSILTEAWKFVLSRITTLVLDLILRQIMGYIHINIYVSTVLIGTIVMATNYIISKIFVFTKKEAKIDAIKKDAE